MRIAIIDNYDSFTYNLAHMVEGLLGQAVTVWRNDQFELGALAAFDKIILSPGPGLPDEAGLLKALIGHYAGEKPILGVCLGHQAIAEVFGGHLLNLPKVYHGIATDVRVLALEDELFRGLGDTLRVGRYHSWVVDKRRLPASLKVTAVDAEGHIMALRHRQHPIWGVQFHPESVLTPQGEALLRNFLF